MAEDKRICPLTYAVEKGAYDQQVGDFDFCREVQCAWWNELSKNCAILVIAKMSKER